MTLLERPSYAARLGVLGEIAERRARDVDAELRGRTFDDLRPDAIPDAPTRDALAPFLLPGLHLIAEVKRRSPSAGALADDGTDVVARARAYERGGAAAVSVLVEPHWFGGSLDDLRAIRAAVSLPLLAKEFVVDERQLPLLRSAGADLVLLLASLHRTPALRRLVRLSRSLGLEPLVEAHDARELERAVASGARIIGINNRDLRTLEVDPERAVRLLEAVPGERIVVAESGVRDATTVRGWRAAGLDAALVGEALMAAGEDTVAVTARTAELVAAGRPPSDSEDPAAADRRAAVKICGVTDEAGVLAAVRAGADAIGLNFVPGTKRALDDATATRLVRTARAAGTPRAPRLIGIFADQDPAEVAAIAARYGLDGVQLSGTESADALAATGLRATKVLHVPRDAGADADAAARSIVERAVPFMRAPNFAGFLLDTADASVPGGTGARGDTRVAALVARELPVYLAGGLNPANVADALRSIPVVGVDVASGVESPLGARASGLVRRPVKDPVRVALFVKRAHAARVDRPHAAARPTPVSDALLDVDERGRWGNGRRFGGRYVPETLVAALVDLEGAYGAVRRDPRFWSDLRDLGHRYVGRPTPLYRADRLAERIERAAGREPGALRLWLKREDLAHTGAHKINNALGQALLTRRLGKTRVIAETGAGQHGVATATACALLDLPCIVYMGAEDVRRQAPNVVRMRALGAEVVEVTSGSATLKDAISDAMRDWVTNVRTTHYVLGSAVGPHPYPTIVRDLQRVIGDEAAPQLRAAQGRLPDAAVACVGGGSNAVGLLARFIGEPSVRLVGVEAAGEGIASGRHAAALAGGTPGVLHGSFSYLLQDADGQVVEAHSISAGLDYPGIGPQLSALYEAGRLEVLASTDAEALDAVRLVAATEGILPALEPAHAIAALPRLLAADAERPLPRDAVVLVGLSGRGDKDLSALGG